ncbi:DUF1566 domain-containing protein [Aeromonas veronii]|uniref:Lcl C-terminal domain-containing protein n=1 Tax=Aeromonas veronii TaxID=654 RepID=UPI000F5F6E90|nr:DUF1566 domain-containing protein [Aeromonas veronii]MCX0421561.1 DUF1566 domain-containing protein [Aeromonas veronii]RRA93126.1 DUF1566 domain-containing protein [Aeromonas veronii bv. sobria]TNI70158.1 hypothetical protein CF109_19925 [Aeromonas veronii]
MSLYRFSFAMLALLAPLAHGAAICDDTMDRTAPSARFLDHGNGTVTDQHTGLTWMRCKLGQTWSGSSCLGEPTVYYWQQGLQVAERIRSDSSHALYHFGGISQWRLPDIKELATLVEHACYQPSLNEAIFPRAMAGGGKEVNEGYVYLMSSTVTSANGQRAYLDITSGDIGLRAIGAYPDQVLLVANKP